jgi:hypothetical protein
MSKSRVKGCCPYLAPKSPPSSYAVAGVLEGERGAWNRVAFGTLQRSLFIAPGLAMAGIRGGELVKGSLYSSLSITGFIFLTYILRKKGIIRFR